MATNKHYEPKEYVWILDLDNEDKIFKCVVTDTECITYEGDREHKHLKITNPLRKNNVLQIDTVTSVYGMHVPFQLENGVPYIQLEGVWKMSDTNREERIAHGIRVNRITSWLQVVGGILSACLAGVVYLINGTMGKWWMTIVIGATLVLSGFMNMSRMKAELQAIREADAEAAAEKAARRAQSDG